MKPITRAQRVALKLLYDRRETGLTYRQFRRTAHFLPCDDCILVKLGPIYYGVEPDGYTHT